MRMQNTSIYFRKKSNTVAAAKERELAWQKIADRVNACNPTGTKRTWQQLKMKYKNILQTANRKKAEGRKTGGGPPPPPPLTEAEEMALSQNSGRPIAEGISGGSSSDPTTPQDTRAYIRVTDGVICLVEPSAITDLHAVEDDDEDTLSAAIEREDTERPIEGLRPGVPSQPQPMIFATPTKVVSHSGETVQYLGANRVPDLQRLFQRSDGVPVHLKRGVPDKLLYRTTMALTIGGTIYCLVALYMASQPRKR